MEICNYAFRDMHAQSEIKMPKARLKCVGDMQAFRDLNTPDMQAVKDCKAPPTPIQIWLCGRYTTKSHLTL